MELLKVENLGVVYRSSRREVKALENINFSLGRGETLGIVGESGSGKTTLAHALMGVLENTAVTKGTACFKDEDLIPMTQPQRQEISWKSVALLFQNSLEVLNPVMKIREQVAEPLVKHLKMRGIALEQRVEELFDMVGLDNSWGEAYPHQLSGGMRQRVLLAMALSCRPKLLLVDEPTTSLDPVSRREITGLLERLQKEEEFSMILISHDLVCIKELTSKILVLYEGRTMETGPSSEVLETPFHQYTRGLVNSSPSFFPYRDLWGIPGEPPPAGLPGCPYHPRCTQSLEICRNETPYPGQASPERHVACHRGGIVTLLSAKGLHKTYSMSDREIKAVQDVDLQVREGELVGLVGETGSGKSTVAQILGTLIKPDSGNISFRDSSITGDVIRREKGIQVVMQDPFSSTNHRLTVEQTIREPLDINGIGSKEERSRRVREALAAVQLSTGKDMLERFCFELSGGQLQRVSVARALAMKPSLLLADEITSMLDTSIQANLLRLLKGLQNTHGFAMLFITHDIELARKVADRVIVMQRGKVVEEGSAYRVFTNPCCCHTKELLEAAFSQAPSSLSGSLK